MTAAATAELLTADEVAAQLRIGAEKVRQLAKTGRMRGSRIEGRGRGGLTWRFKQSDVDAYLTACQPSAVAAMQVAVPDDGHARRRARRKAS